MTHTKAQLGLSVGPTFLGSKQLINRPEMLRVTQMLVDGPNFDGEYLNTKDLDRPRVEHPSGSINIQKKHIRVNNDVERRNTTTEIPGLFHKVGPEQSLRYVLSRSMGHWDSDTSAETAVRVTRRSSRTDHKAHGLSLAVKVLPLWQREKRVLNAHLGVG
ncbi:hypothetical protein L484_008050 [Morus notabilis]|uniref:Uncharacterized protein n=1 Tax=Morus notabilis TaxID=981085 RepID=W9QUG8_9ROSA|nr:hypothetical protein L484_008050 [Morus notabilis]